MGPYPPPPRGGPLRVHGRRRPITTQRGWLMLLVLLVCVGGFVGGVYWGTARKVDRQAQTHKPDPKPAEPAMGKSAVRGLPETYEEVFAHPPPASAPAEPARDPTQPADDPTQIPTATYVGMQPKATPGPASGGGAPPPPRRGRPPPPPPAADADGDPATPHGRGRAGA
jgi:hypothetical protein